MGIGESSSAENDEFAEVESAVAAPAAKQPETKFRRVELIVGLPLVKPAAKLYRELRQIIRRVNCHDCAIK